MSKPLVIELSAVGKNYGDLTAVSNVSFGVAKGEFVALAGPNGAGKSTLFKLILGLIKPTAGQISLLGLGPTNKGVDRIRKSVGFLPEQVLFHAALTGRETLAFYTRLKSGDCKEIDGLLERVGLTDAGERRVGGYSKGMRQRLALAQCLIGAPEILMLDEPTSGLDPASRRNFFNIIEEVKASGAAVLMSSHALSELEALADRVVIMNNAKLVANGSIAELKTKLSLTSKIKVAAGPQEMGRLAEKLSDQYSAANFVNGVAVLECDETQKIALLKTLLEADVSLDAINIDEPRLDHVFATLTDGDQSS